MKGTALDGSSACTARMASIIITDWGCQGCGVKKKENLVPLALMPFAQGMTEFSNVFTIFWKALKITNRYGISNDLRERTAWIHEHVYVDTGIGRSYSYPNW
jgi:hypothetical protein